MLYEEISVSKKSKVQKNYLASTTGACFVGYMEELPVYQDFIRIGDDCTLNGKLDGVGACADFDTPPQAGDSCGEIPIQ